MPVRRCRDMDEEFLARRAMLSRAYIVGIYRARVPNKQTYEGFYRTKLRRFSKMIRRWIADIRDALSPLSMHRELL